MSTRNCCLELIVVRNHTSTMQCLDYGLETRTPEPTVAEIIEADPTLETLTTALKAANLFDTLGGDGPFTVFAPNDSAFAELGDETIAALLAWWCIL